MKYPFDSARLSFGDLIPFVADFVYQDEAKKTRRNKVRNRVSYAKKKGALPEGKSIDADVFFGWAIEKYPQLREIRGLPIKRVVVVEETGTIQFRGHRPLVSVTYSDVKTLQSQLIKYQTKCSELEDEVHRLKGQLAKWSREFPKYQAYVERQKQYGTEGGRGNEKK